MCVYSFDTWYRNGFTSIWYMYSYRQICMYAYVHICLCNISRMHGATQFWHSVGWCLFQKPTAPKTGSCGVQEWYTLYMVLQYMWKIWRTNMGEPTIKHSSGRSRSKGLRKGQPLVLLGPPSNNSGVHHRPVWGLSWNKLDSPQKVTESNMKWQIRGMTWVTCLNCTIPYNTTCDKFCH